MRKVKQEAAKSNKEVMPATSPESQQSRCIALAMSTAESQLRDGTASSQVITHFLKLATEEAKLEREKMELEKELLKAKTKAYESSEEIKALYTEAMNAMMDYRGGLSNGED